MRDVTVLDADLLLLMPTGPPRQSLRRRLARRVRSIRVSTDVRRLVRHLRSSPHAVALVDPDCLDETTRRLIERERRLLALVTLGEDLPRPDLGGSSDGPVIDRVLGSLERRLATARRSWLEGRVRRSVEGVLLVDPERGDVVLAGGLAEELLGTDRAPGPGRESLRDLVGGLTEQLPIPAGLFGELTIDRDGGPQRVIWEAVVEKAGNLSPRVLCVSLCDQTVALNWLERRGEQRWLDSVAATAEQLAHDFNNILQAILSHLDLLRLELAEDGVDEGVLVEPMEKAAEAGVALTSRILSLTRSGGGRQDRVALESVLEEVVKKAATDQEDAPSVSVRGAARACWVRAERARLVDALAGLVRVAAADGSGVVIEADHDGSRAELRDQALDVARDYVVVRIRRDCGEPEADRRAETIRRRQPALSSDCILALAVAQRVLAGLGGTLMTEMEGEQTCGAAVYLPVAERPQTGGAEGPAG